MRTFYVIFNNAFHTHSFHFDGDVYLINVLKANLMTNILIKLSYMPKIDRRSSENDTGMKCCVQH